MARPHGHLQLGSSPRTGTVVGPFGAEDLSALLKLHRDAAGTTDAVRSRGERVLVELLAAGVPPHLLRTSAVDRSGTRIVAVIGKGACADVLRTTLAACDLAVDTSGTRRPELVVLVDEHAARAGVADGLIAENIPHLSVVLRDTDALVGPLVYPGLTPCLRCLDLYRTDDDPGWPLVLDQFTRLLPSIRADAPTATTVAGLVALQVLTHLDGGQPTSLGATMELLVPEGTVQVRRWNVHPQCGCVELPLPEPG